MTVIAAYFEQKWFALEHLTKIVYVLHVYTHVLGLQSTPTTPNIQLIFGMIEKKALLQICYKLIKKLEMLNQRKLRVKFSY